MTVVGLIVLLFQALLLAHGGLTTLGANTFSMAIVGPLVSYGIFKLLKKRDTNINSHSFSSSIFRGFDDLCNYSNSISLSIS